MMLAESAAAGRVALDTCLGEVVPTVVGSDLSTVTLLELATHTSGLPRMPLTGGGPFRAFPYVVLGLNPYRNSPTSVIELASRQVLHGRGQRRYSNIGGAVLGEALAAVAATDYASLLADQILNPLAMRATAVSVKGHVAPWGRSSMGLPREPWILRGYAPAGGVISTLDDLVRLAVALVDGSAPGATALLPIEGVRTDLPHRRTGLSWIIDGLPDQDPSITWHNGGTGGYSSFIALLPASGRAVIAMQSVAGRSHRLARIALELVG
jgi:CubicO group peptidase (beta-lactamase class C family)